MEINNFFSNVFSISCGFNNSFKRTPENGGKLYKPYKQGFLIPFYLACGLIHPNHGESL